MRSSSCCGKSNGLGVRRPTSGSNKVTNKQSDRGTFPALAGTQLPHLPDAHLCDCGGGWMR